MRQSFTLGISLQRSFNPRICKRCDFDLPYSGDSHGVSIHASVKDATDSLLPKWLTYRVSIHASVKDATGAMPCCGAVRAVSIHASVKDATQFRGFSYKEIIVSIHASVKDATCQLAYIKEVGVVSIHASVKDATYSNLSSINSSIRFNPRICKRCDLFRGLRQTMFLLFQSTHL